jgi:hypothetical protein
LKRGDTIIEDAAIVVAQIKTMIINQPASWQAAAMDFELVI